MKYVTQSGDMFDLIAHKTLGSCRHAEKIINANRQFVDVLIFNAGVELTIPDIETITKVAKLPPWRN